MYSFPVGILLPVAAVALPGVVHLCLYYSGDQGLLMCCHDLTCCAVQPSPVVGRIWSYQPLQLTIGGTSNACSFPPVMVPSDPSPPFAIVWDFHWALHPLGPSFQCGLGVWMTALIYCRPLPSSVLWGLYILMCVNWLVWQRSKEQLLTPKHIKTHLTFDKTFFIIIIIIKFMMMRVLGIYSMEWWDKRGTIVEVVHNVTFVPKLAQHF